MSTHLSGSGSPSPFPRLTFELVFPSYRFPSNPACRRCLNPTPLGNRTVFVVLDLVRCLIKGEVDFLSV